MNTDWQKSNEPPELAAGELHVWAVPLDRAIVASAQQWHLLAVDERQRAERFRVDDARRRFVMARAVLRQLLGRYLQLPPGEVVFAYDATGKPRLTDVAPFDLMFNLAHSGELALVAFARGCEVGVDVERLRTVGHWQEIAERFFHPREVDQIAAAPHDERITAFLRCWTGKEAVLKAIGTGITRPLDFLVGANRSDADLWIELPVADRTARCWLQPLAPAAGYLGAVACLGAERRPRCFSFA